MFALKKFRTESRLFIKIQNLKISKNYGGISNEKIENALPLREGHSIHERHHFAQSTVHEFGYFTRSTAYCAKGKKVEKISEVSR